MIKKQPEKGRAGAPVSVKLKGESLFRIYRRRFRKHTLGRIGLVILIVLYTSSLFAGFLSPYTMTWTDKRKSFHPPSRLHLFYTDARGRTSLRPFCYELIVSNVVYKSYVIVPEHTLRAVTIETLPGFDDTRIVAVEADAETRRKKITGGLGRLYGFPAESAVAAVLEREMAALEALPGRDVQKVVALQVPDGQGRTITRKVWLIKGNKNFLGFFSHGVPYKLLGLFSTNIHFFGSSTGGYYALGGDELGRDLLSRLLHGGRISLSVGLVGILISFSIGLLIGGIAGYFGGIVDLLLMRACEVILSFPSLILLFALRATFPPNLTSIQVYLLIIVIISFISWASLARVIRGMVLSLKNEEFVLSARAMGLSHLKIITRHILRNTLSFIIIQATISIPGYILGESALSLLGLGITDPQSSWGLMLAVGRNTRYIRDFPWLLIPGFLIFLAIMAWNFLGDGIRDAVDPHKRREV